MISFRKASKKSSKLRMAIDGPAGSGKTFTALRMAMALANGKKIAVINTEQGAIEKYLGDAPDGMPFDFDIVDLPEHSPTTYTSFIIAAGQQGYGVLIIDSLSHAWSGSGGALELKDRKGGNSFTAWKDITPMHNAMIEAILKSPCHVIATMRSKMEHVMEDEVDPKTGAKKTIIRKVGMAPIQRAGMEYEFDIVGDMDWNHTLTVSKSRCSAVDGAIVVKPGANFIQPVINWLSDGTPADNSQYVTDVNQLQSHQEAAAQNAQSQQAAASHQQRKAELQAQAQATAAAKEAETSKPIPEPAQPATAPGKATIQQLNDLLFYGNELGLTKTVIAAKVKEKFNCLPSELPTEIAAKMVDNFRNAAATKAAAMKEPEKKIEQSEAQEAQTAAVSGVPF